MEDDNYNTYDSFEEMMVEKKKERKTSVWLVERGDVMLPSSGWWRTIVEGVNEAKNENPGTDRSLHCRRFLLSTHLDASSNTLDYIFWQSLHLIISHNFDCNNPAGRDAGCSRFRSNISTFSDRFFFILLDVDLLRLPSHESIMNTVSVSDVPKAAMNNATYDVHQTTTTSNADSSDNWVKTTAPSIISNKGRRSDSEDLPSVKEKQTFPREDDEATIDAQDSEDPISKTEPNEKPALTEDEYPEGGRGWIVVAGVSIPNRHGSFPIDPPIINQLRVHLIELTSLYLKGLLHYDVDLGLHQFLGKSTSV